MIYELMNTLTIGGNTYEVADAKARERLDALEVPASITWDGNTDGLFANNGFYKVSDATPDIADLVGQTAVASLSNNGQELQPETMAEERFMDIRDMGQPIVMYQGANLVMLYVQYEDMTDDNGVTIPSGVYFFKGDVYHVSEVTLPANPALKALKKNLDALEAPNAITWDGDTTGRDNFAGSFYRVSEDTPEPTDFIGCRATLSDGTNSTTFIVTSDLVTDGRANGEPMASVSYSGEVIFVVYEDIDMGDGMVFRAGLYFAKNGNTRLAELVFQTDHEHPCFDSVIVKSSTPGSSKFFSITVDDSGTIKAVEV